MVEVKILEQYAFEENGLPEYADDGCSGMDLRAFLPMNGLSLKPNERVLIPTRVVAEIPQGYEVQIRSRSGLTLKKGLVVANSPGTIDASYRGEWKIILHNISDDVQHVAHGERVAQAVLAKVEKIEWKVVPNETHFTPTERGSGGFGSTGENSKPLQRGDTKPNKSYIMYF